MWMRTLLGYVLLVPGLLRLGFEVALLVGSVFGLYQPTQETTIFGALLKLFPAAILILLATWILRSRYSEADLLAAAKSAAHEGEKGPEAPQALDKVSRGYSKLSLRELLSVRNAIDRQEFAERYQALSQEITRRARAERVT